MADAHDLGSCAERHGGSSPLLGTMKIKFLGTSAGWPLPRLGCNCGICISKDPKDTRTRTQLLVNDSILVDAGPDTYRHLKNVDIQKLDTILISHEHPDHTFGLWDLTHVYNQNKIISIIVTKELVSRVNHLLGPHKKNLRISIVQPNKPFQIGNVKIEYFPVIHGKTPAFGIKLKEHRIFIYITDFNRILPSQEKTVRHADYWAIDGSTLGKIGQSAGHISITDGIILAEKYKIKHTYFIHIGHKTGTHKELEAFLNENAASNFHIPYDGLELDI